MPITAGSIADRIKKVGFDQFSRELDQLLAIKTRSNGSRYLSGTREITGDSHSFAEIGEAICGISTIRQLRDQPYGMTGGRAHTRAEVGEAGIGGAMGPSQFAAINYWSGTMFKVLEGELLAQFENPELLGSRLTTLKPGTVVMKSRQGRYSPPTSKAGQKLQPNQPIPMGSMNAEWIDTNPVEKNGQSLAIASEDVLFDGNQGAIVTAIGNIGYQIAWNKEDKILKPVLGIHNTYAYGQGDNQASTSYNTYLNSANPVAPRWLNQLDGTDVTDETKLDSIEQIFMGQHHPSTGYPVNVSAKRVILGTPAKKMTLTRLQRMTSVEIGARDATGVLNTGLTYAGPVLDPMWSQRAYDLMLLDHPEAEAAGWSKLTPTQAKYRMIFGDPARAFHYRETRPFQSWSWNMTQDPSLAMNDTFMVVVALEQGSVTVAEPRHVVRVTKDA